MMDPIEMQRRLTDEPHEVELGVRLAQAVMGARAEDEPVLGRLLGVATDPSIRIKRIGLGIHLWVVQGGI